MFHCRSCSKFKMSEKFRWSQCTAETLYIPKTDTQRLPGQEVTVLLRRSFFVVIGTKNFKVPAENIYCQLTRLIHAVNCVSVLFQTSLLRKKDKGKGQSKDSRVKSQNFKKKIIQTANSSQQRTNVVGSIYNLNDIGQN